MIKRRFDYDENGVITVQPYAPIFLATSTLKEARKYKSLDIMCAMAKAYELGQEDLRAALREMLKIKGTEE